MNSKVFFYYKKCRVIKVTHSSSGLCIFLILFYFSCHHIKNTNITREILYEKNIHKQYPDIFTADSLLFYENENQAYEIYSAVLENKNPDKTAGSYFQSRLLCLEKDSATAKIIYDSILSDTSTHHPLLYLGLTKYIIKSKINFPVQKGLHKIIDEPFPFYYKGQSCMLLGNYFDEVENEIDSAWFYFQLADKFFHESGYITPSHQECIEKLSAFATYRRKNLLAIRYANELFNFSKYWPETTAADSARAYANRAFMMFREDDFSGSEEDIQSGLALIFPDENPELYQSLMKSYLVIYMLRQKDSLWWEAYDKIKKNVEKSGKDFIDLDRWKGQFLFSGGKYQESIPFVTRALKKEIRHGRIFSARYSTLCYMLSDSYLWIGNYSQALQYMYANQGKFTDYNRDSMLTIIRNDNVYGFSPATECADIYYTAFQKTGNSEYLYDAHKFLELVDQMMYKQMKVTEENALLEFYLHIGHRYFNLGLHVHYHLFTLTKDSLHLHRFLEYSEKRKNSLLHRDMLMTKNEGNIPEKIVKKEFELRAQIKEEKRKGLRSNHQFDALMDEYIQLEKTIEKNHKVYFENGLTSGLVDVISRQKLSLKKSQSILAIDETDDTWYFTKIYDNEIRIFTRRFDKKQVDSIIQFVDYLAANQDLAIHAVSKSKLNTFFPKELWVNIGKDLLIIPDGIYHRLPLEEMFDPNVYKVRTIPSLRVWQILQKDANQKSIQKVAVFAFSDLETIKGKNRTYLAELPGTYKEAQKMKKMFPDVQVYSGKNATRENFWKVYNDPKIEYIHLALHGKANSSEKDDVKLYFRTKYGGLDSLYGYELLRHRSQCKKVVLSACQSGLGKYIKGEGNYSLPRYFMLNGAKEVRSSLWDVKD